MDKINPKMIGVPSIFMALCPVIRYPYNSYRAQTRDANALSKAFIAFIKSKRNHLPVATLPRLLAGRTNMHSISSISRNKFRFAVCLAFAANSGILPALAEPGPAQIASSTSASPAVGPGLTYADIADLASISPLIAKAVISQVILLKPPQAAGVRPGYRRAYVTARVLGLIRGEGGVSPSLSYLYDIPVDARGKVPKLKKQTVLLFARLGSRPGDIQLTSPDAQLAWSSSIESQLRNVVGELLAARPAPKVIGLGDAFHVAGTVTGEGETQIFLRTDSGEPVSLSVVRRPGQPPRWAVALGEIVDEAAATPKPGSLLWYRLACSLPSALPATAVRTLAIADAEAARADYQVVLDGLGSCERTRIPN